MRKFIEEYEREMLLLLVMMLGIARWWIPPVIGFENMYGASHWVLSYDHGLVRRGLIGALVRPWLPVVAIEDVHRLALAAYCILAALLIAAFYALLRHGDRGGRLFRLIVLFTAAPVTLSLVARNLGRFDLFLVIMTALCFVLLALKRHLWLIPLLMTVAMFIHEGFLVLWAPALLAAMLFIYLREGNERKVLAALVVSAASVAGSFLILYLYGNPAVSYDTFARMMQARASFRITDLALRECFFGVRDHFRLTASTLYDAGSLANFGMALLILSPLILILANLWAHVLRSCRTGRFACRLLVLAGMSGLALIPVATDYGRWLSAIVFCNFFLIFFLVRRGHLRVEDLAEYAGGSFATPFVVLVLTYLLLGPFHDWNPYPYAGNVLVSALAGISVLGFDVWFWIRWRSQRSERRMAAAAPAAAQN